MTGGNIFMDLSAHDVDFITDALEDEVVSVYATGTSSDPELEAASVHDNATMVLKMQKGMSRRERSRTICMAGCSKRSEWLIYVSSSSIGTVVTIFMSRSAVYGYDQRCEIFGTEGLINVANVPEHTAVVSNRTGIRHSRLQHSFPQRFQQAFGLELDAFANTLIDGAPWPVTAEQCVMVQRCADAARISSEKGTVEVL